MDSPTFPASLRTATLAEGHRLARQLAERQLAEPARHADMAAHLSTSPPPSVELLTATYFQAVVAANRGWES